MGFCKDCAWWTREDSPGGGAYLAASEGICELTRSRMGKARHPESKAYAMDDDYYGAALTTDAYFGCTQFEEKG